LAGLPLIERLRVKSLDGGGDTELLLTTQYADLDQVEDEFWQAFEGLDREAVLAQTLQTLEHSGQAMTLAALTQALPPGAHDLETLTLWLALARESGAVFHDGQQEQITTRNQEGEWQFTVPHVALEASAVRGAHIDG
jgi:hypothetical protein